MYPMTYPRQPSLPIPLRRLRDTAAIAALALCSALACAGRPLVSETADVIGAGGCELETSVARQVEPNHPKASMADAQFACGLGGHSQFGLLVGGARSADGTDRLLAFVGKTNLVEPAEGRTGFGLAYSIWTGQDAGESWRHAGSRLYGIASRELAPQLLGHLNLGWLRRQRRDHTTWSLGIQREGALGWAVDLFGDDRSRPWLSGGLIASPVDKFSVNLSLAQRIAPAPARLWTLGAKIEF